MGKQKMTAKDIEYIRVNYMTQTSSVMAAAVGLCSSTVRRYMRSQGWKTPASVTREATAASTRGKSICTPEQDAMIREKYLSTPVCQLARQLGVSTTCLKNRYRHLRLVVPRETIDSFKQRFKTGEPSPLRGRKQSEYMSPEAIERTKATRFKKGGLPHNAYDRDGVISTRKYKSGRQYKFIRIALAEWVPLHINTYEKLHGPIPKGHLIVFRDGDTLNCDPDNLALMSREEYQKEHGISATLDDSAIACWLSTNGRKFNRALYQEIMSNYPDLIELKRHQLQLQRELKKNQK